MKGKFVKGDIIKLAILEFENVVKNHNELTHKNKDIENMNYHIDVMVKYQEAIDYLKTK